jgi:deoxyadenosine/deoxycytidine kinase
MLYRYIAIEGNIGVGKTTLAQLLAARLNAKLVLEKFRNNHFLPLFYNDMEKYGLHVELSFLIDRLEDIETLPLDELVVSDYFFSKTLLFARNNLDLHAYKIFERVYTKFEAQSKKPDLIIYLHRNVDELLKNIEKRGRKIEQKITGEYLTNVQSSYDNHFSTAKDLRILSLNIAHVDFNKKSAAVDEIIGLLQREYKPGITNIKIS